jgi:hypothetical protein
MCREAVRFFNSFTTRQEASALSETKQEETKETKEPEAEEDAAPAIVVDESTILRPNYVFFPFMDSCGHDAERLLNREVDKLVYVSNKMPHVMAFNTNGWMKTLWKSWELRQFGDKWTQGTYVKKEHLAAVKARKDQIPKILHHILATADDKTEWQQMCARLGWTYQFWSEADVSRLLADYELKNVRSFSNDSTNPDLRLMVATLCILSTVGGFCIRSDQKWLKDLDRDWTSFNCLLSFANARSANFSLFDGVVAASKGSDTVKATIQYIIDVSSWSKTKYSRESAVQLWTQAWSISAKRNKECVCVLPSYFFANEPSCPDELRSFAFSVSRD